MNGMSRIASTHFPGSWQDAAPERRPRLRWLSVLRSFNATDTPRPGAATAADTLDGVEAVVLVRNAVAGHAPSVRALLDRLSPVVARRVTATLRRRAQRGDVGPEIGGMVEDILVSLFQSGGDALLAWDPARRMSLDRFVDLLAQQQVLSLIRRGSTSPWHDDPTDEEPAGRADIPVAAPETDVRAGDRLTRVLDRFRETLSPRGLEMFQRIVVEQQAIGSLQATTCISHAELDRWRGRFATMARTFAAECQTLAPTEKATPGPDAGPLMG
jgi:hypothetical protein